MGDIYAYKQVKILSDWNEVNTMAGDYIDMIAGLYGPNVSDADKKKYGLTAQKNRSYGYMIVTVKVDIKTWLPICKHI